MSAPLRWGILGAARFAREHMAPAIVTAPGGELAALASGRGEAAAPPFRSLAPALRVHHDYAALLEDDDIDAVYIPLPNHMHVEWTLRALKAGKHVLCEKPMAMHADDFTRLIKARDASGQLAAEAFMIVHHPQWRYVRELLRSEALGDLRHVEATFCFNNTSGDDIRNRPETGGGALRDIGVYILGAVRHATGTEPRAIEARMRIEHDVDAFTDIQAEFPGFTFTGTLSTRMSPFQRMCFYGSKALLTLDAPFNGNVYGDARVTLRRDGGEQESRRFNDARQYELQLARFNRSARDATPYPCPLEFSRGTQAAIDTVFERARRID